MADENGTDEKIYIQTPDTERQILKRAICKSKGKELALRRDLKEIWPDTVGFNRKGSNRQVFVQLYTLFSLY